MASQIQYYKLPYDAASGEAQYEADLQYLYPTTWSQVEAEYPLSAFPGGAMEALVAVTSDDYYVCPGREISRALAGQPAAVHRYIFEHAFEASDFPVGYPDPLSQYGAYHLIDVPYVFHDVAPTGFTFAPDEVELSTQTGSYFLSFAASADPNSASAPVTWPAYTYDSGAPDSGASTESYLDLDTPPSKSEGFRNAECDFWKDF